MNGMNDRKDMPENHLPELSPDALKGPELHNREMPPEQPIPTPGPAIPGHTGPAKSGAPALATPSQGDMATEMPPELMAAVEQSDLADAREATGADAAAAPKKAGAWQTIFSPIVALVAICLVTSLLLGLTNSATAPLIEANLARDAESARQALLPEADGFNEIPVPDGYPNVTAVYVSTNGVGGVVESFGKGYGGKVPATVAFDSDGNIVGVSFPQNNETPGLGQKLYTEPDFASQFTDVPAQPMELSDIDTIASATISSRAALNAINAAVELYDEQYLGKDVPDANAGATANEGATGEAEAASGTDGPAALPNADPSSAAVDPLEEADNA